MPITKNEVKAVVKSAIEHCKLKYFEDIGYPNESMWQEPLIGFSSGADPYFKQFKEEIGAFFWSPSEAFLLKLPAEDVRDGDLTVVSIVLPQTEKTKSENKAETDYVSKRWLVSRGTWEPMIADIHKDIIAGLSESDIMAVAIDDIPEFSRMQSEKYGVASKWSHRHAAFVSGLGTFGLSDGLITEKGMAVRISTILLKAKLDADERKYSHHYEYCLFHQNGSCGMCIKRCPIGAITKNGHDKDACNAYLNGEIKSRMDADGLNPKYIASCGLCQTGVPCQDRIPGKV